MKAVNLLKETTPVKERAEKYAVTIKRNLKTTCIDPVILQIEKLEVKLDTLLDFSLDIDLNKGIKPITCEEAEDRFKEVLNIEYELVLLRAELKAKQAIYDEYFSESE